MSTLNDLFERWESDFASKCPDTQEYFNRDGIVSTDHWQAATKKILFLLKETNDARQDIRCAIQLSATKKTGWKKGQVLRRVGRWAYGLENYNGDIPSFEHAKQAQFQAPLAIAYMNLKKTAGGAVANNQTLIEFIIANKAFIHEEIKLINPDIIVMGGVYSLVKKYIYPELKRAKERVHTFENRVFINAHHPAARKKSIDLYTQVLTAYHNYCHSG